ncbi:50S ribosomal protein L24 [Candidatus Parcubacteria bacterium]|nr:50S ribosomal protein L24 [Patescibacteria group bacterium]MBU4482139.1 50S ribosomal protein L24 [Patescibacteria group bacterium]MCG2687070.1 50S ribosomal protein L24 [Candidatus Parcubacteria bacterium]
MKIKKSDSVKILCGKDQGKTGKVLNVLHSSSAVKTRSGKDVKIVVEGLNLRYKHLRPKKSGEKGQRIMFPAPMNISDVQLICPKCGKPTRVGFKIRQNKSETTRNKKQRICKKCKNTF